MVCRFDLWFSVLFFVLFNVWFASLLGGFPVLQWALVLWVACVCVGVMFFFVFEQHWAIGEVIE